MRTSPAPRAERVGLWAGLPAETAGESNMIVYSDCGRQQTEKTLLCSTYIQTGFGVEANSVSDRALNSLYSVPWFGNAKPKNGKERMFVVLRKDPLVLHKK
ncbi:hypothetical protein R1flu_007865 [Riccia fluitans]|uniref:Uncharacterized protein n=1 Tax=Riccia fluitans TaxID=41844 RepID=A0ABD1Z048_9MARC